MKTYVIKPRASVQVRPIADGAHRNDREVPDGGWKPLSRHQKARLAILAREAYARQADPEMTADDWRRETAIRACGVRISEACQSHWADLKAAFLDLAGQPERAFQVQMREGDNKRRVALHKLTTAMAERSLELGYAAAICRAQFKCRVDEASAKQLWCLFYTVTNRRKKSP